MLRRFLSTLITLSIIALLGYTVLLSPAAEPSRAAQDLTIVNKTVGCEISAEIVNDQLNISLKNIYDHTLTAWSIGLNNGFRVTSDDAYSEVHTGILPGEVLKESYPLSGSIPSPATLYLHAVLFEDGSEEGDARIAQQIKQDRLGVKVQFLRVLKVLQKHEKMPNDLPQLKWEILTALDRSEAETVGELNEALTAGSRSPKQKIEKLSDDVKNGLIYGRARTLRRFEELEQFPSNIQEEEFSRLKKRTTTVLAKL